MDQRPAQNPNKVWMSLLIDVILPVLILNKLSKFLGEDGPLIALLLAISLPLCHGLYDFIKEKKINWISLLGLLNVLLTGGFALLRLEGIWFAVKEAGFPFLIGIFVFFSAFSRKPLFSIFLSQPGLFDRDRIEKCLEENFNTDNYKALIKRCTFVFSGTFFLSALLNFVLAVNIFEKIPAGLSETESAELLNEQIASMTWMGYVVIAVPLMIITSTLFFYYLKTLSRLTQLTFNQLIGQEP